MPHSFVIHINAKDTGTLTRSHPVWLNGAFYTKNGHQGKGSSAAKHDFRLSSTLHDKNAKKPFTISPILGLVYDDDGIAHFSTGEAYYFRVTCLDEAAENQVEEWLQVLEKNPVMWLQGGGKKLPGDETCGDADQRTPPASHWAVTGISKNSSQHPLAGGMAYQQFISTVAIEWPVNHWKVHFLTPVTFHADKRSRFVPFPLPELLVGSWFNTWQQFSGVALNADIVELARRGLKVVDYDLRAIKHSVYGGESCCSLGWVELKQCQPMLPRDRAELATLFRYAFYCGTGFRTTQGLGQTMIEEFRDGKDGPYRPIMARGGEEEIILD